MLALSEPGVKALIFTELLPGVELCSHCSGEGLRPFLPLHSTGLESDRVQAWVTEVSLVIPKLCTNTHT